MKDGSRKKMHAQCSTECIRFIIYIVLPHQLAMWNPGGRDLCTKTGVTFSGRTYTPWNMDTKNLHLLRRQVTFSNCYLSGQIIHNDVRWSLTVEYPILSGFFPDVRSRTIWKWLLKLNKGNESRDAPLHWVWDPNKPRGFSLLRGGGEHPQSMAPMPPWPKFHHVTGVSKNLYIQRSAKSAQAIGAGWKTIKPQWWLKIWYP